MLYEAESSLLGYFTILIYPFEEQVEISR